MTSSAECRRPWGSLYPYKSRRNCSCCRSCSSLSLLPDGDNPCSKGDKTSCSQYKTPHFVLQSQHHGGFVYTFLWKDVWFTLSQNFLLNLPHCTVLLSTLYTLKINYFHICYDSFILVPALPKANAELCQLTPQGHALTPAFPICEIHLCHQDHSSGLYLSTWIYSMTFSSAYTPGAQGTQSFSSDIPSPDESYAQSAGL